VILERFEVNSDKLLKKQEQLLDIKMKLIMDIYFLTYLML